VTGSKGGSFLVGHLISITILTRENLILLLCLMNGINYVVFLSVLCSVEVFGILSAACTEMMHDVRCGFRWRVEVVVVVSLIPHPGLYLIHVCVRFLLYDSFVASIY